MQAIKLLGCEKGKKGRVNLLFLAGDRLLSYVGTCYEREKVMTSYLKYEVVILSISVLAKLVSNLYSPIEMSIKSF